MEVADTLRAAPEAFFERSRKWFTWLHLKIFNAFLVCRTPAFGGHVDACARCGHRAISFNSCLMGSVLFWRVCGDERTCSR